MKFDITTDIDDIYYEKITIEYDEHIIYDGYVVDLVETNNFDMQLNLNYGNKSFQNAVIIRKLKDHIIFIPQNPYCFRENYKYILILITQNEMKNLWNGIKYDFEDDITIIKEINIEELLLSWYITSGIREYVDNLNEYINVIEHQVLCTSLWGSDINDKIMRIFVADNITSKLKEVFVCNQNTKMKNVTLYFDNNIEWNGIKINSENKIYLNLNDKLCISIDDEIF